MAGSDGSSYTSVKQTGASAYPYTAGRLSYVGGSTKGIWDITTFTGDSSGVSPSSETRTFTFIANRLLFINIPT